MANQTGTNGLAVLEEQALILLIAHLIDLCPEFEAIRFAKDLLQLFPILEIHHPPAVDPKHLPQPLRASVGHDAIQALPIQIHNPEDPGEPLGILLA